MFLLCSLVSLENCSINLVISDTHVRVCPVRIAASTVCPFSNIAFTLCPEWTRLKTPACYVWSGYN